MIVYIITRNQGYEGYTIPEAVFSSIEKANEYVKYVQNGRVFDDTEIIEVELDSWNYYEFKKI